MIHPLDPFGFGRTGYARAARRFEPLPADLRGLTVAITGANSGLGLAATRQLAARGATIWMLVRDVTKGERARADVGGDTRIARVDVADVTSIRALDIPTPDVLVHNAGMLTSALEYVSGPKGPLERTVATHVVGPWVLGHHLRSPCTIWVASGGMYTQRLDVATTFSPPARFDGVTAYARCKRAQVVLARRLGQHAMHPGWADSPGVQSSLPTFRRLTRGVLRTLDEGADTIVWLAATRPATPAFWFDRAPAPEHPLPWTKHDPSEEDRLVEALRNLTGVG